VEIHEMSMEGDVMRMRQITALPLPAGEAVTLKPGGFHIMLTGLKQALRPGQTVPLTLWVEGADGKRSATEVQAQVKPLGTR
jgi:copper(I)-binding protein